MLKIGAILFAIGVFLLLPFDEIIVLAPLVALYGLAVIPVYYAIALAFFLVGAFMMGIHIMPWLFHHPVGILCLIAAVAVAIYLWSGLI